ncbi:MAG: hypothetical protein K0S22_267 [Oscillospiraceae bacterium]|nr:hypothetical protein [Oscillospiraceae bacterium]
MGERSHTPNREHEPDALRNARRVRSAIRQTVGTHNFLATRGVESYEDIVAGVRFAQTNHAACRDELIRTQAEIDRLKEGTPDIQKLYKLEKCAHWCGQYRAVSEQFKKLKLFRGRFYQNHKDEIDIFNYASKKLQAAGYNDHIIPDSFKRDIAEMEARQADKLKILVARRGGLIPKLNELREELRLWSAAEIYMRELLDIPNPEQALPNFSVPSVQEGDSIEDSIQAKLQRVSDLAHERKQKAPVKSHQRDDRG